MCYNGKYNRKQKCEFELIPKNYRSPDYRLKFVYMKMESLVIADHYAAVNMLPDFIHTARHIMEVNFV